MERYTYNLIRELSRGVTGLLVAPATLSLLPGKRNLSNQALLWIVAKVFTTLYMVTGDI